VEKKSGGSKTPGIRGLGGGAGEPIKESENMDANLKINPRGRLKMNLFMSHQVGGGGKAKGNNLKIRILIRFQSDA